MNCDNAISLIHEYLDGDIEEDKKETLKQHLETCSECAVLYEEFTLSESILKNVPIPQPSEDLSEQIMAKLSVNKVKKSRTSSWFQLVRRHPAITAAAIFLIMMMLSLLTLGGQGQEFAIKGDDLEQVEIRGNEVIVPEGTTVNGNLVVENGSIRVEGRVQGDVTVVDGSFQLASTAAVTGKVTHINQWIDRLWYTLFDWINND